LCQNRRLPTIEKPSENSAQTTAERVSMPALTSTVCVLSDAGVLAVRGSDGLRFLQGQLSNDTARLADGGSELAGLHTPQGRCVALLRLIAPAADLVLAVLPAELVPAVRERLRKFVLRAKVSLLDESAAWRIFGIPGAPDAWNADPSGPPPLTLGLDDPRGRRLAVLPREAPLAAELERAADLSRESWRALDIEAGLPQVQAATSELFVAQMLNLDVLGGIAFDKGCYTGQEVIARAHYRGRVKRRLQRFVTVAPIATAVPPGPGFAGRLADGRAFTVVESVQHADGRCEFLAVAPFAQAPDDADPAAGGGSAPTLECETLALPYALPGPLP
jgi:folate-binding protein YgfZ